MARMLEIESAHLNATLRTPLSRVVWLLILKNAQ
jgi:hypothetical protein